VRRVSGPLLDRIDMRISVPRVVPEALLDEAPGEPSASVAGRIAAARARALRRSGVTNGRLTGAALLGACRLDGPGRRMLAEMATSRAMTARGIHRTLRVARTIADLAGHETVDTQDLTAAVSLREDGADRLAA
jgi:magnesium chelatase family protein